MRSGTIGIHIGNLEFAGNSGYGWSHTASESDNIAQGANKINIAIALVFRGEKSSTSDSFRYYAFPLRCLAS